MTPIRTNKPVFFGDDGEVLKSGKIYIGQPNQWPIDFPKTVTFQDSAGSQFTASQPLTTDTQGRITYNGKPMIALVDGNYSVLVRDRNGVTVGEGYTPFVENAATAEDGNSTIQVGLLLSDIKAFDVTPGETVRNVGKATTLDNLGADWLVVSNTGGAADDVDLIDFANGTQGQRIGNKVYRTDYEGDLNNSGLYILDDPVRVVFTDNANTYRNVWTSIDLSAHVPVNASSAILRVTLRASYASSGVASSISVIAHARKKGSATALNPAQRVGYDGEEIVDTSSIINASFTSEFTVPLAVGAAAAFEIYITVNDPTVSANNTTPDLDVTVIGYTINAKDLI